jgi:predicted nucleotidyltransferase
MPKPEDPIVKDSYSTLIQAVQEITRRIVSVAHPQRVVLFGSAVKGNFTPDSDLDFLVIVRPPVHRRKLAQQIYRELHGVGVPVDVVVATTEDVEKYRSRVGTILRPALQEGQVLFEA